MPDVTAKLATVIDPGQLAFNAGSREGIRVGTIANMYRTVEVTDPVTNEPLGAVRVPKLGLRVNFVEEKFCVAEVTDTVNNDLTAVGTLFATRKKVTTTRGAARSDTVFVEIGETATFHTRDQITDEG